MRIISGKWGGRKLVSFKADHLRPTTDRIKEVIFNKLQGDLEGAQVLDLFSGTGNLSLESLSRAAGSVVSVEKNAKSISIIKKNMELLGVTAVEMKLVPLDVFTFLKRPSELEFDLVLIDPPFTESLADRVMQSIADFPFLKPHVKIFIESGKKEVLQIKYNQLVRTEQKDYGDKKLSLFQFG